MVDCDEEDTFPDNHHDLLLENLLNVRSKLIISIFHQHRITKETNWKQKFKKTPNCKQEITKINAENNGNLQMLSFGYNTCSNTKRKRPTNIINL